MKFRSLVVVFVIVFFGPASSIAAQSEELPFALADLSVVEAAEAIRSGDVTSESLVTALIARIERYVYLNAFVLFDAESVLEQARAADTQVQAGTEIGPLHGVPVLVKDNIDVAGLPTTAATRALVNNIPETNAPVVDALIEAGAIILGKANMHEIAVGSTGVGSIYGPTLNPYNPLLFSGGSSSGSAAAVAARLTLASLGTDTGGSIRMPASMTGIYGFRPTIGRYSQEGIFPIAHSRDTAGPLARSVADIILLDGVISGENDSLEAADPTQLRLGVPRSYYYANLDRGTAAVVEQALVQLQAAGVTLVEADIPVPDLGVYDQTVFLPMAFYEIPTDMSAYLANTDVTFEMLISQLESPDVRGLLSLSSGTVTEADYQVALDQRAELQAAIAAYIAEHDLDAILFPTTPLTARAISAITDAEIPENPLLDLNGTPVTTLAYSRNVNVASNANLPGLSLPVGLTPEGLPVGMEIDGLPGEDRALLAVGLALESVLEPVAPPVLP